MTRKLTSMNQKWTVMSFKVHQQPKQTIVWVSYLTDVDILGVCLHQR
jgi:hypothetical protein